LNERKRAHGTVPQRLFAGDSSDEEKKVKSNGFPIRDPDEDKSQVIYYGKATNPEVMEGRGWVKRVKRLLMSREGHCWACFELRKGEQGVPLI